MKRIFLISLLILASGCGIILNNPVTLFDLGMLKTPASQGAAPALPPLVVAEATAPAWLDSQNMYYRLAYVNDQQPRAYASSRWIMSPARLFEERLKARIMQAGGETLPAAAAAANLPLLRIETNEFSQIFSGPQQSHAQVTVRVAVMDGRSLLGQKTFNRQAPAPSPDAAGGAAALAVASDAIITDMIDWLSGLPLKE